MKISLILLIKNGAKRLNDVFEALEKQTVKIDEIVIVDSGSIDASLKIIKSSKLFAEANFALQNKSLKLYQIKPEEFSHGGTRNFAVSKTSGEIVVFLTQDAVPQDKNWLKNLIKPLIEENNINYCSSEARTKKTETSHSVRRINNIAGVFGRQIPWPETDICEKYFYGESYSDIKRIMDKKDSESFSNKNIFFSNVNGAVKKEYLNKFTFRNDLVMSEDQFWGREVLRSGNKIAYEPKAGVWHSHNYNFRQLFQRYLQSGYSQKQMNLKGNVLEKGAGTAFGLLGYVLKNKPWLLPYAIIYEVIKGGAFVLGKMGLKL